MGVESVRIQRRGFLRFNLLAFTAGVLGSVLHGGPAHAIRRPAPAGVPLLNPDDPQAKAMSYIPDVISADADGVKLAASPASAGQKCSTCQLYSGSPGAEWGPCAIFSYRTDPSTNANIVVSSDGWCRGWAPRAT